MGAVWRSDKTPQDGRNTRALPCIIPYIRQGRRKTARRPRAARGVSLLAGGGYLGWQELESSRWQSQWLSRYAADPITPSSPVRVRASSFPRMAPSIADWVTSIYLISSNGWCSAISALRNRRARARC